MEEPVEYATCGGCEQRDGCRQRNENISKRKVVEKIYRNESRSPPQMCVVLDCGHRFWINSNVFNPQAFCNICPNGELSNRPDDGSLKTITGFTISPKGRNIEVRLECGHKLNIIIPESVKFLQTVKEERSVEIKRK